MKISRKLVEVILEDLKVILTSKLKKDLDGDVSRALTSIYNALVDVYGSNTGTYLIDYVNTDKRRHQHDSL